MRKIKKLTCVSIKGNMVFHDHRFAFLIFCSVFLSSTFFCNKVFAQPQPTAFVSVTGPTVLCENATGWITFDAPSGTPPITFAYSINGGAQMSVTTSLTTVSMSFTSTVGNISCDIISVTDAFFGPVSQSGNATLTFQPLPTASIVPGVIDTICADGGTKTITGVSGNGTPTWGENGAGSFTSGANTNSPTYTAAMGDAGKTRTLKLTVTSNNTCVLTDTPATAIYLVPVRKAMTASKQIPTSDCQNGNAVVVFRASNGTPPYTFNYTVDGVGYSVSTVGTNSIAAIGGISGVPGAHTYNWVSVRDANCSQTLASNPKDFSVFSSPIVSVVGDPKACRDDSPWPYVIFKVDSKTKQPYTVTYSIDGVIQPDIALNADPNGNDSLKWPNSTAVTGIYTYSLIGVVDGNNCPGSINLSKSVVTILEHPNARFSIDPESTPDLRPTITLNNTSIAATGYLWDFGDGTVLPFGNPHEYTYKDTGTFHIKLVAYNDICSDSTLQTAYVFMPFTLYIPSAFTPNNDGVNDTYTPKADGFLSYSIEVYDRWGIQVFYSDDINKGWDGKLPGGKEISQMDSYAYVIRMVALDLKTYIYYGYFSSAPR